ncbi:hypothetical protein BDP27DRAFT_1147504, partial [Rhodocollybia butyracea]
HIPRSQNAFILFRIDYLKNKHVPGSVLCESSSSLGKVIARMWRELPEKEKAGWQRKALEKKAEHKRMYPGYKFCPDRS